MEGAQNVAQAVVIRSRSSLASWSCMGPRRRAVAAVSNAEQDDPHLLLIENGETVRDELYSEHSSTDPEETEDEDLIPADHLNTKSAVDDVSQSKLWSKLKKKIHRLNDLTKAREEVAAAAKEITEEESEVLREAVEIKQSTTLDTDTYQFYPPGRIMHMVVSSENANSHGDAADHETSACIYETPRDFYNRIRLSPTMINDHYMPMYRKTMDLLIDELGKDDGVHNLGELDNSFTSVQT